MAGSRSTSASPRLAQYHPGQTRYDWPEIGQLCWWWFLSFQAKQSIDMKVCFQTKFECQDCGQVCDVQKTRHWVVMVPAGSCFGFSLANEIALVVGLPKIWLCIGPSPRMAHRQSSAACASVILRPVEQKRS